MYMAVNGMNIKDLAQAVNIDKRNLEAIMKYPHSARLGDLHAICDVLGIEIAVHKPQK